MQSKYLSKNGIVLLSVFLLFGAAFLFFSFQKNNPPKNLLVIGDGKIEVEFADNYRERYRGLSDRDGLCDRCGMLFVFPSEGRYSFVMRGMKFPLDFVWMNSQTKKVVGIIKNVSRDFQGTISSQVDFDLALEVPAGTCERFDIKPGSSFYFQ